MAVASTGLMIGWGFGVACMTGGVPTMHPCIMAFAYGRKEYQAANRIIMAIQLIPSAVAAQIMVAFMQTGQSNNGLRHAVNRISSRSYHSAYDVRHERCQRSRP
ncbi:hypothetical protein [Eubacterium ramulus]|uniref:hypothetical protein n=1 Tax=Eubacterium ramulus TaxID=39490 RepID=UPI00300F12F3